MNTSKKFQNQVFWYVFIIAVGISSVGFCIEKVGSYSLLKYRGIKFGSYGFNLAKIPARNKLGGKKVVVLLGNSVYQYGGVPTVMRQIAEERGSDLVLMNMAQVSATIYDYLVQAGKVVDQHPDLVVMNIYYWTYFTTPRFATNCDQMAFDYDVLRVLPWSFYARYFNMKTAIYSAISSIIPLKRADPIIRWEFKLRKWLPEWFLKWVTYPHLNIGMEEGELRYVQRTSLALKEEEMRSEEILQTQRELLDVFRRFNIPVLFIWQETSTGKESKVIEEVRTMIGQDKNAMQVDYKNYWNHELFGDEVHPGKDEIRKYATRHLDAITNALSYFESKRKVAGDI